MKLRSLKLHLFRQHVESELNLGDGLTGILGANGAGKTTIVEAISFALFGSRAIRGKIEELRTRGMRGQRVGTTKADNEPRVELTIEHDGNVFRIDRSLSDAQIFAGGEPEAIATGNREVSAKISNLLGMSYEEFTATYCTEQKGLEFLGGKKGVAERERFIVRMMGFDRLEEVQEALRSDRKEKRSVLAGFEASLGTREDLEIQLKQEEKHSVLKKSFSYYYFLMTS